MYSVLSEELSPVTHPQRLVTPALQIPFSSMETAWTIALLDITSREAIVNSVLQTALYAPPMDALPVALE